jgi:glycosyltransferase involved in cell wall biosynthesis
MRQSTSSPVLSVVVPVHQGDEHLRHVLVALLQSELPRERWELIVVDDASTDNSAEIAAGHADLVVRLTGRPRGPAYARNRGFEVSRGSLIAFVDADVSVHPLAMPRMVEAIEGDATIGAVIGAYDASRTSGRLLSEYRNLLRHIEHQRTAGDTDAFSAGLALVRRDAFIRAGMFDEWRFPRPQSEALELGDRLRFFGYRIVRRLDVQASHLKRWTLREWIRVDFFDRGMSVARLNQLPDFRARANRLYLSTPLDALLAWTTAAALAASGWRGSAQLAMLGAVGATALVVRNANLFSSIARARGVAFAVASVPLHLATCAVRGIALALGRALHHAVGEPQPDAVVQAFAEVGVRTWPPVPAQRPTSRPDVGHPPRTGTGIDREAGVPS